MEGSISKECPESGKEGDMMNDIDTTLLETQQDRIAEQAGNIIDKLEEMKEEEFDRQAKAILEQYDRNKQAILQARRRQKMEKIFTVEELSEYLKLKPKTIRRYLRNKTINGFKIGYDWRIMERDVMEFLEKKRQKAIEKQEESE